MGKIAKKINATTDNGNPNLQIKLIFLVLINLLILIALTKLIIKLPKKITAAAIVIITANKQKTKS